MRQYSKPLFYYKWKQDLSFIRLFIFLFHLFYLFKNIENNLLKYDLQINGWKVSWCDVIRLWNLGHYKGTRVTYKLTEKHIRPSNFDKMKCKLGLRVFSKRVSSALFTAYSTKCIKQSIVQHTLSFFNIFSDLFDNLNSRSASVPNPNKCTIFNLSQFVKINLLI
jgi:hypothetical protein